MSNPVRYCLMIIICFISAAGGPARGLAQEVFRNPAMEDQDTFQQSFNKARQLTQQGRLSDAIKEFNNAARLREGKCAECFHMIGQIYFSAQEFKEAAKSFRQAADLKSEDEADILNWLGVSLYLQDDKKVLSDAIAAFNRSIELSGGKIAKAYFNLGYSLIKAGREAEGVEALKTYLEKEPGASDASIARAVIANPKLASVKLAPPFKIASTEGAELSLDTLKGKIVLLDFWATWCGPCLVEMPEVKKLWKKYGGDNFVIVGINMDRNRAAFENYVQREELTWPQHYDGPGSKMAQLYGVRGIPHTVLIDEQGVIRAVGLRANQLSGKIGDLLNNLKPQGHEDTKKH